MHANLQSAEPRSLRISRARQTAIFRALADPNRFELVHRIARAGSSLACTDARASLAISAATLSHHIKELESAGLIEVRREGKFAHLTLRPGVLAAAAQVLSGLEAAACDSR